MAAIASPENQELMNVKTTYVLPVKLKQCESDKQYEVFRSTVPRCPDRLPYHKHVVIEKLCKDKHSTETTYEQLRYR